MKIEHIALWTNNIDKIKNFYIKYFNGKSNNKYINKEKHFESYFISFKEGTRLELMTINNLNKSSQILQTGYTHIAFSVGGKSKVDELTELLKKDGYEIVSNPRTTGDGYYESVVKDPDGNIVEITI